MLAPYTRFGVIPRNSMWRFSVSASGAATHCGPMENAAAPGSWSGGIANFRSL
jgi:hypothetical protein